jgi:hypothetical protein
LPYAVSIETDENFFLGKKRRPLAKPSARAGSVSDGVLEPLVVELQTIPLTFADDKFRVRKVSEPLGPVASWYHTPTFFFQSEIPVTSKDGTNGNNDARVTANKTPRVERVTAEGFVKLLENSLLEAGVCERVRRVMLIVDFHPVQDLAA